MGRVARRPGRRLVPRDLERDHLRGSLFELYRADQRYQQLVRRDLRPAWLPVYQKLKDEQEETAVILSKATGMCLCIERDWVRRNADLDLSCIERQRVEWPELDAYIGAVYECGVAVLGLLDRGAPARWAASLIHVDVASGPDVCVGTELTSFAGSGSFELNLSELNLRLRVHPLFGSVGGTAVVMDGSEDGGPMALSWRYLDADDGCVFDRYDEIVAEVETRLRAWCAEVRAGHERAFPRWRNEASLQLRDADLPRLYRALFYPSQALDPDQVLDKKDGDRLRKLARLIGVDFPRGATESAR